MSDPFPPSADDDALDPAAEYVLGLTDGPERAQAAARIESDPAFRAAVEAWEHRLGPLLDSVAPAPPPPHVWARIARSVEPGANVAAFRPRPRLWDQVGVWRTAAGVLAAAAACLAVAVLRPSVVPPSAPAGLLAATLRTSDGKPMFVATIDRTRDGVTVVPVNAVDGRGRFPELWIIRAGGKPAPVGMVDAGRPLLVRSATISGAGAGAVFAVSLEPAKGSPTGAPTGPVIATGAVEAL